MGVNCSFCRGPKDNGQHDVDLKEVREVSSNSSRGSEEDLEDADVDEEAMETPSADKRSQQTFMLMNQNITEEVQKCSNVTGGEGDPGRQHATSTTASLGVQHMAIIKQFIEAPITGEPRQLKELLLATIEKLVDKNYDLLPAQMLLEELKGMLGEDEWKDILESPLLGVSPAKSNTSTLSARLCIRTSAAGFLCTVTTSRDISFMDAWMRTTQKFSTIASVV